MVLEQKPTDHISGLHARLSQQRATMSHCSPTRVHERHPFWFCLQNRQPVPEGVSSSSVRPTCSPHPDRPLSHQVSLLNLYHNSSKVLLSPKPSFLLPQNQSGPLLRLGRGGGGWGEPEASWASIGACTRTHTSAHTHRHTDRALESPNKCGEEGIPPSQRKSR